MLSTIGFLFPEKISELIGSDLDPQALEIAAKNLALLSPEGLGRRQQELAEYATAMARIHIGKHWRVWSACVNC